MSKRCNSFLAIHAIILVCIAFCAALSPVLAGCKNPLLTEIRKLQTDTVSPKVALAMKDGTYIPNAGSCDFGDVTVADTKEIIFIITNDGPTKLVIPAGSVQITGADSSNFSIGKSLPASIPVGGNAEFSIGFHPGTILAKQAVLTFATNDSANPVFWFSLTGKGIDQVVSPEFTDGAFQSYPGLIDPPNIMISCGTADAKIYYTLNGNDPSLATLGAGTYLYPQTGIIMTPITATIYIKAFAVMEGLADSVIVTATISDIALVAPEIAAFASNEFSPENPIPPITMTVPGIGNARIFYTLDDSTPTESHNDGFIASGKSITYTGPHTGGSFTLRAVAFITGIPLSSQATPATYTFKLSPPVFSPAPKANPAAEFFTSPVIIAMSTPTISGTTITYTVDAGAPVSGVANAGIANYSVIAIDSSSATVTRALKAKASMLNWLDSNETAVQAYMANPLGIWGETVTPKSYWDNANWE